MRSLRSITAPIPANNAGGDTNVAATWVTYANVNHNWGVKYWEIGNEIYGNGYYAGQDWEYDLHYTNQTASARVGQPALSPAAYGTNAIQFISRDEGKGSHHPMRSFLETARAIGIPNC